MSTCPYMLLLLLRWPFSCSINVRSSSCAIDPALILWLLKASCRQNAVPPVGCCCASPCSARNLRVWTVLFISIVLEFSPWEISFGGMPENINISIFCCWCCLCHFTWHLFFLQSWSYWTPTNPSKLSSNAVFLVRHFLTSQSGLCNLLAHFPP